MFNALGAKGPALAALLVQLEQLITALQAQGRAEESVSASLSRMEQHDRKSLGAMDTFASAIKSLSSHLIHLRDTIQQAEGRNEAALQRLSTRLESLCDRLDSPRDDDGLAATMALVAERLERLEHKVDRVMQQPILEPDATSSLLNSIATRLSQVESKVQSGADGASIAACLLAVDRRLTGIEGALGMARPLPAKTEEASDQRVDELLRQVFETLSR